MSLTQAKRVIERIAAVAARSDVVLIGGQAFGVLGNRVARPLASGTRFRGE